MDTGSIVAICTSSQSYAKKITPPQDWWYVAILDKDNAETITIHNVTTIRPCNTVKFLCTASISMKKENITVLRKASPEEINILVAIDIMNTI